jgi:hypothetical protein
MQRLAYAIDKVYITARSQVGNLQNDYNTKETAFLRPPALYISKHCPADWHYAPLHML